MNQTLNASQQQAPQKVAMPLRIALLVLPSTELSFNGSSTHPLEVLQPELYRSGLLSFETNPFETATSNLLKKIKVDDFGDTSFEKQLHATVDAIENGQVVQLSTEQHSLLMMPALKAAQMRIHPHALLCAMQKGESGIEQTLAGALNQAKRDPATVSKLVTQDNLTSEQQFAAVYQLITELASRTTVRDEMNAGVELGPKQAKSHYWFTPNHQARVAAISFSTSLGNTSTSNLSSDQSCTSYILAQGTGFIAPKSIVNHQRLQFVLSADTQAGLLAALDGLNTQLTSNSQDLLTVMRNNLVAFEKSSAIYAITLQASSLPALLQELNVMAGMLPKVMSEKGQFKTPAGSYFTAEPLGTKQSSGLAFVYPGVGTVYGDMFSELHRYFPSLYSKLEREGDLKSMLQADAIYNVDAKIPPAMPLGDLAIAGVGSSYLLTQLLVNEFNITPNFALGYSMGEASMWASLGVWSNPHTLIEKTQHDPLFTRAISGPLTAVRKAWQLSHTDADIVWNSFVVRAEAESIEALLPEFPHAYLAIIQGDTCVIAGCETQCRALLTQLGKRGIAANRVTAMHTAPAMEEHANVVEFYTQPLQTALPTEIKFISAANLTDVDSHQAVNESGFLDSQLIATSIADTFCNTLNFTALIHSAQKQGAKLFVELGADRQNCTLIDKIVKLDHASETNTSATASVCTVPVNAKGGEDITTLLKALGQLISHRVPLSVQPLIDGLNREIALQQLHDANPRVASNTETHMSKPLLQGEV
ncbi:omega-3 polyunsaturated fatty acid synthase PfaB [Shewanella hanedai]|nr:PfaB family protein [Shewanella hanedai]GGI81559.1 omega-3 polyunsaturated fatty acid synthase PfaB [Shewanella hanedai]